MNTDTLSDEYFKWMCDIVCNDNHYSPHNSYEKLLNTLNTIHFEYSIPMDGNRAEDGIDLRYRFGYENGYEDFIIANYLDISDCSILEMLIALSMRCEEHIMNDPEIGNRTAKWFWDMIRSLDIYTMDDSHFSNSVVNSKIDIFMNHKYAKNGRGGLFTIDNPPTDLRTTEIWYQMNWYLYELGET